jgi:hypothetical protein
MSDLNKPEEKATNSVSDQEKLYAILAHVLGIFTGFIGALVIYIIAKPEENFAK